MDRGEISRLPAPRGAHGHEQPGARYAVVVQADEFLDLRSPSRPPLVEQTIVVDPGRLGRSAARLDAHELRAVDDALMLVLGL